jgi:HAE1 family hydrophobic/amphiphilic exporter-1
MTAIATILALVPLAAGFNQGSIIAAELGTVVIGGLFSSTFLTLIVVPVVYSLVAGGKAMLRRERQPGRTPVLVDAVARVTSIAPLPETPVRFVAPAAPVSDADGSDGADAQRKLNEIRRILGP